MHTSTRADAASLYGMSFDDITDRLAAMRHQESTSYRCIDYLGCVSPLTPSSCGDDSSLIGTAILSNEYRQSRNKMAQWCYQLTDICKLSRHAVARSMNYLDRFLATDHERAQRALVGRREYQLAAMTALYISIKLHEPLAMEASLLAEISQGCYTVSEILSMERSILEALEWRVNGPTPQEFVSLYLGLLDPRGYSYDLSTLGSLLDVSTFQCELAAGDYDLSVGCTPSVVALASILNSLEGMDEDLLPSSARCDFMARLCAVSSKNINRMALLKCVQLMLRRLFCQNSGVHLPSREMPSDIEADELTVCSSDSNDTAEEEVERSNYKTGQQVICQEVTECSSPVCVTARYSRIEP